MGSLTLLVPVLVPSLVVAQPADSLIHLDELWATRDTPEIAKELETSFDSLAQKGDDYEMLWRAARIKWWLADGATGEQRKVLAKQGWDLAERAVKKNPKGVEGKYFAAGAIGAYSQAIGILNALSQGLESKFNERLDAVLTEDPNYHFGGPIIAKARYYYELPWPKRDLAKSAKLYHRVIEKFPQNLRAYLWLAETELKDGNPRRAMSDVQKVLAGDISYDPPEGRRVQAWAEWTKKQIEEKLK